MLAIASAMTAKLIITRLLVERLRPQGGMDWNEILQELAVETRFTPTLLYFRNSNKWIDPFHQPKFPRIVAEIIRDSRLEITWNTTGVQYQG